MITSLALNFSSPSWTSSEAFTPLRKPKKATKRRVKKADFATKKGFFITVRTKAFNWTAKLSIKASEKNLFRKFWLEKMS